MSRAVKGHVLATYEVEDSETGAVTACVECRNHFTFRPGDPGCMYQRNGDPGWPSEPAEVELDFLEVERVDPETGRLVRTRYSGPLPGRFDLREWAQDWLDDHPAEVVAALPQGPDPDDARDAAMERAWEDRL